jgi:hypothetical protein
MGVEEAQLDTTGDGAVARSPDGAPLPEGAVVVPPAGTCLGQGCPCNVRADCKDSVYKECVGQKCAECTTEPDTCPLGSYCLPQSNTCTAGCNSDKACETIAGQLAKFCAIERHQCVQCKVKADCPNNDEVCTPSGICAKSCADGGACPVAGQTCCPTTKLCVDLTKDPGNCGACDRVCPATNQCCSSACKDPLIAPDNCGTCGLVCNAARVKNANNLSCAAGKCTYETCQANFGNCNNDKSDGCECQCPPECNSCANGVCVIQCGVNGCQTGKNCPPNWPCKVVCNGEHACQGTINCAAGKPCTVECLGGRAGACDGLTINKNGASSQCVSCSGAQSTCSNVSCTQTAGSCSRHCEGTSCTNTCNNCTDVASCP